MRSKLNKPDYVWGPLHREGYEALYRYPPPMDRQKDRHGHLVLHLFNIFTLLSDLSHGKLHLLRYKPDDPEDHEPGEERGTAQLPIDTTSASLKMTTENNSKFLVPHHLIGP